MKRFFSTACMLLALLAVMFAAGRADVPEYLSYQGVLADGSGTALPDGSYNVTFRLYTGEAGGSPIWEEAHVLTVTKGIFNARLGSTVTLGALDFDLPYYLGISVEGEAELASRVQLTGAAYAMNARMVKGSAATANRIPASGFVGIGTTTPGYPLTITSDHPVPLYVNGGADTWAGIYINALQSGGNPMFGYCRQGLLKAYTAVNTGDTWYLYVNGDYRIQVTPSGNVGIGAAPLEKLHVGGGLRIGNTSASAAGTLRWTGSDFEGHDGSTWKSLTSTGGGGLPAGTAGQTLRHDGDNWVTADNIFNDGTTIKINNALSIDGSGATRIGGAGVDADLRLFRGDIGSPLLMGYTHPYGGVLDFLDENGKWTAYIEMDRDGEGGYMWIARDPDYSAFIVDGNYNGTNEPRVSITGSARGAHFLMDQTGNASVVLPAGSIAAAEILDEPGAVSYTANTSTTIATTMTVLASQTINAPTSGYVLVIGTCQGQVGHVNGTATAVDFGVSDNSSTLPDNQDVLFLLPASAASGTYAAPTTCHGLFSVSAGANTFYMLGRKQSDAYSAYAFDKQLTAIFIPTSYGTIMPTLASGGPGDDGAPGDNGMTASEIADARSRSIEADNARIQRELDEMRAELENLREDVRKQMNRKQMNSSGQ